MMSEEDLFVDTATMPLEYYKNMKKEILKLTTDKEQLNSLVNSCQEEIRRLNFENQKYKEIFDGLVEQFGKESELCKLILNKTKDLKGSDKE